MFIVVLAKFSCLLSAKPTPLSRGAYDSTLPRHRKKKVVSSRHNKFEPHYPVDTVLLYSISFILLDFNMKVLSLNFLTCAVKACKSSSDSYPLHPKDAELVQDEIELNPQMLLNVLPRLDWAALRVTASEVSFKH